MQVVGSEHAKNHRHHGVAGDGGYALAHLVYQHVKMGGIAADNCPKGDEHVVATGTGQILGHQGDFKTAGHPGQIQLGTGRGGVDAMATEAIEATAKQFARDKIVETGDHHSDAQVCGIGETAFKNGPA